MDQNAIIDAMRPNLRSIRVPDAFSPVYKKECQFCFDTPFSEGGLFINLKSHMGYGKDMLLLDHERSGGRLYLHLKWEKKLKEVKADSGAEPVVKLAIGVDGGFQTDDQKYETVKHHFIFLVPEMVSVPFPDPQLPELVSMVANGVLNHADAGDVQETAVWEEEIRESKYARTLVQESNGKRISSDPSQWVCEESGLKENLWMNLSDGHIGSGRRNWDGTGGTGAALTHYKAMKTQGKNFPLVVKLGTITPNGADVYSYAEDENDAVKDPLLAEHLRHWGINVLNMKKTEKSMTELQIELNKNWEFDKITEAGKQLVSVCSPGHIGLRNLGNSCYMNSVLQCLFSVPLMEQRYVANGVPQALFRTAPQVPADDILSQLAKLSVGLLTDRYTKDVDPENGELVALQPSMFRHLVAKGSSDFSSGHQQDACEYFQYLLSTLKRLEHPVTERLVSAHGAGWRYAPVESWFQVQLEERYECLDSHMVRYTQDSAFCLSLPIPLEDAVNSEHLNRQMKRQKLDDGNSSSEEPKPCVLFSSCVSRFASVEALGDFYSSATRRRGQALKRTRIQKFPQFLVVQMRRYYVGEDWTPKKLEVMVDVPEEFDFNILRDTGRLPNEQMLPEDNGQQQAASAAPVANPVIVAELVSMGFSENGCKRAVLATKNAGAEPAMDWILSHMEDADFNDPLPTTTPAAGHVAQAPPASEEDIAMLCSMGFSQAKAIQALARTSNDLERAVDWLFSHADEPDDAPASAPTQAAPTPSAPTPAAPTVADAGSSRYVLRAFVSHIGSSTLAGHYVCHIKDRQTGKWILYNDRKVAISDTVPKDLGYLYFFEQA
eukprot:c11563_g1_i1.p1 GENE.c11563_g1_i1~~c11563_g1_i1.p1  ORF type:complete len:840 (+),score=204.41 c11563_g1_i1:24-2522(+)